MVPDSNFRNRGEHLDPGERGHTVFQVEGEVGDIPPRIVNASGFSATFFKERESAFLNACYRDGCVISVGSTLILARPVHTDAGWDAMQDINVTFDEFNCWYIDLAYGSLEKFVQNIPFDLPFVGYEHRGKLSLIPLDKFKNHGFVTK